MGVCCLREEGERISYSENTAVVQRGNSVDSENDTDPIGPSGLWQRPMIQQPRKAWQLRRWFLFRAKDGRYIYVSHDSPIALEFVSSPCATAASRSWSCLYAVLAVKTFSPRSDNNKQTPREKKRGSSLMSTCFYSAVRRHRAGYKLHQTLSVCTTTSRGGTAAVNGQWTTTGALLLCV